jgi:signal transduction histidine kinase
MFSMEYPCHSPTEKRWFTAYVTPFAGEGERRAVVAHVNITAVKLAEDALRALNAELEERVVARTAALLDANRSLQRAIAERKRLENEVIDASEMERQRIGQDLHDDLGQQLAGLWFFSAVLEKRLREKHSEDAPAAARISELLDKSLSLTRSLARGLHPVVAEPGGLMAALRALAEQCSELFKVRCRFACQRPVHVHASSTATHLFRIAQEAVTNAGKHSKAKQITIQLSSSRKKLVLSVSDDGVGLRKAGRNMEGLGFRTMQYRADALGGSLVFRQRRGGGTVVVCTIPEPEPSPKEPPRS